MDKKRACARPFDLAATLCRGPDALARIEGSASYRNINGTVSFYKTARGTLVYARVGGLPTERGGCKGRVFAFHIHEGSECRGNYDDPFAAALSHYNPCGCEHPHHAGDMPPLFEAGGEALLVFLTDRFSVDEIVGKTVIIHAGVDDFTSQPAGNAGEKIACGVIRRT
ncbi:MAG: superoxide dismutase family protein [Oscillospiraceae bacterium]|nr:superoxide dismutase family protein [Oscillospiraceae bacterium]